MVEIQRDRRKPVLHLSGELPCDPNQSSVPPGIDYSRLTPGEAKETHKLSDSKYDDLLVISLLMCGGKVRLDISFNVMILMQCQALFS